MDKTIRVGAVSYLNTKPLMYGFRHGYNLAGMSLVEDYPARIADMLLNDEIDVGLVPVAVIPKLASANVISDYCIGADGEVASVCLFSDVPLDQIQTILLDYQSRTSVALARILIHHHWKINVKIVAGDRDFERQIGGTTAAVVIGDRAFEQRTIRRYFYDLAEAWVEFTGLPFVFAAWVANKPLPQDFVDAFNRINEVGLQHFEDVAKEFESHFYDLAFYYSHNISYRLDDAKKRGMARFLALLAEEEIQFPSIP